MSCWIFSGESAKIKLMKFSDVPKVDRPREKLEKYGPDKLSNAELLAILLRTGKKGMNVMELARKIMKRFTGASLATASFDELKETSGLGTAKVSELIAAFTLAGRLKEGKRSALIMSPKDVWNELKDIRDNKKEHFVVFFLDVRNQEIRREIISVGTLNASLVHPREVFEPAILHNAAQILIAHNHPSGNPEPSTEDLDLTKRLKDAGSLMGIELIDHVIVTKDSHLSLKQAGKL